MAGPTEAVALAAGATMVALAFAASLLERWWVRRRPHELAWAVAVGLFAAGATCLWAGATLGWGPVTFRCFYLFGAVLNVPFLALGTIYLLLGSRRGHVAAAVVALTGAFAAGVVAVAPLTGPITAGVLPRGSEVFGPLPRVLAAVGSSAGSLVVLAGALAGARRLLREPDRRRLAAGNAVIALGTMVLGASGLLNSVLGQMEAFSLTLTVGITILFAGFLLASPPLERRAGLRAVRSAA